MIEFKADCGHTVRAKDEDAGSAVRCTYCGRKANVPDEQDGDLDFLFSDVEQTVPGKGKKNKRRKKGRGIGKRPGAGGQFNPFAIVLRMCYAALLISIVVFVGGKYVLPLFEHGPSEQILVRKTRPTDKVSSPDSNRNRSRRKGLADLPSQLGLYVGSTPPGAMAYFLEADKAPRSGRINEVLGCKQMRANGEPPRLDDGTWVVEVVLPTNDYRLNDRSLPYYQQYRSLRYKLDGATEEQSRQLLDEYFIPDGARPVFCNKTEDWNFIVRQFRNVQVRNGRSTGVRALFLPRIPLPGRSAFSIAQLVTDYLPKQGAYTFDETYIRDELEYYGAPPTDRQFIVDALARIGVMPYVTADGHTKLAKIDIHTGECSAPIIRRAGE